MSGNDNFTVLLLEGDGTNGSTTIPNNGIAGVHSPVVTGTVQISTSAPKFGTGSILYATSGDVAISDNVSDFTFAGDFTIDFWVNFTTATLEGGVNRRLFQLAGGIAMWAETTGKITFNGISGTASGTAVLNDGAFHHIALTRSGATTRLFTNGTIDATLAADSGGYSASPLRIGSLDGLTGRYAGNIDEFRVSKGIARWTANFTPPTLPYSSDPIPWGRQTLLAPMLAS